jgi:hypothetical protein
MGWMSEDFWFDSCFGQEVYLFSKLSTPALGPTQLHFQWVLGIVSSAEECSGCEAEHLSLLPRLRMNRAVPPLSHMPSWRGQGLYPFLYFVLVVHGDAIGGSTARVRFCMGSLGFFIDLILLAAPRTLGSIQPLTEMRPRGMSRGVKATGA